MIQKQTTINLIKIKLFFLLILISTLSFSTTTTATSSGAWASSSNWDNGIPSCGDTVVIPSGITINVYNSIYLDEDSSPACNTPTIISVAGTLYFVGGTTTTLFLACNSVINVATGGTVDGEGNRKYIEICQDTVWTAADGPIYGEDTLVPVEFLSFDAEWVNDKQNSVLLNWETATETNNDYFEIQRSYNTIDWTSIGKVNGAGNSNRIENYNFIDYHPTEKTIYYRLKQVDYDKIYDYSKIIAITKSNIDFNDINIYPNPIKIGTILNINLNQEVSKQFDIKIYSIENKIINFDYYVDFNKIHVSLHKLQAGIYILKINNNQDYILKRIVVYK